MKVLLTGGAGFIGRHVIDALLEVDASTEILVYDNFEPVVHGRPAFRPPVTGFTTGHEVPSLPCDVRHLGDLVSVLERLQPDVIVHLAAAVSVASSFDDPRRFIDHNVLGTATLWQAIHIVDSRWDRPHKPFVVNLSSMSVYGHGIAGAGVTETWTPMPLNVYAASKFQAEQLSLLCGRLYHVPVCNLRLFNTYGPGQSLHNAETGVIAIWLASLIEQRAVTVYEDGQQLRDFIYVTDVATAIAMAVHKQVTGTFNIGSGVPRRVGDVAMDLAKRLTVGNGPTPTEEKRHGDARHCWANVDKAHDQLQFEASTSWDVGISRTVAWALQQYQANVQKTP